MPECVLLLLLDAKIFFKIEYNNITHSPLGLPSFERTATKVLSWLWNGIELEICKFPVHVSRFGWSRARAGFGRWTGARTGFRSWTGFRSRTGGWAVNRRGTGF